VAPHQSPTLPLADCGRPGVIPQGGALDGRCSRAGSGTGPDVDDFQLLLDRLGRSLRLAALTLVAEIGDIGRFPSARKLCAWAGLTPQVRNLRPQGPPRPHHQAGLTLGALDPAGGRPDGQAPSPCSPTPTASSPTGGAATSLPWRSLGGCWPAASYPDSAEGPEDIGEGHHRVRSRLCMSLQHGRLRSEAAFAALAGVNPTRPAPGRSPGIG
jgi:Transposase IS116/IS110/IS902 family